MFVVPAFALRTVESVTELRATLSGGRLLGAVVLTETDTEPEPATVTVLEAPSDDALSGVPEDEMLVTGDEPAGGEVFWGMDETLVPPPLHAATPTARSATSAPIRNLSTKALRANKSG